MQRQSGEFDLDENGLALLLGEFDHKIRNLLMMIEAVVRQTQWTNVEDYRTKLMQPILGLRRLYEVKGRSHGALEITALIEHTVHPHCADGTHILASGPDLQLEPDLALALHLVLNELATNAKKYGALSSPRGRVKIEWKIRHGGPRKLAIVWTEQGGPEVRRPQHSGFGSRLIKTALKAHGGVRLDFNSRGLACFMLIHLDRPDAGIEEPPNKHAGAAADRNRIRRDSECGRRAR